ncbi:MAG: S-layer homology domain-containing protein, partial [Oscillibacter sp.]|nr:S-layer homology domain-containing protein [Oscillibacter sp.]
GPYLQETVRFDDVATDAYYAKPVSWAVEQGITSGTSKTTFSPSQNCTMAQILTFLWRSNGSPKPTGSIPFSDVKSSDYYADAAAWAYEKGMVSGGTFGGNIPCTRSMAVTYMWKAAGSPTPSANASFTDISAGTDCASAVAWAVEKGVTSGTSSTTFSPDSICTRGQIVTFLHRAMGK